MTRSSVRREITKLSISNEVIARELQIPVKDVKLFRNGNDQKVSDYKLAVLVKFISDVKRNRGW